MPPAEPTCQGNNHNEFTRPACPYVVYRFFWYLRSKGVLWTAAKTARFLARRISGSPGRSSAPSETVARRSGEELGLQPGDLVEVKSEQEILATLDGTGKTRGLVFMPGMRCYCGRQLRVYKRVEHILFEESGKRRAMKNTVLLEGAICDGDGVGCDRSCFYFWREAWLRRVQAPPGPSPE